MADKTKILIVDDDVQLTGLMTEILKTEDFEVYTANDSASGLKLVESVLPNLILLDWMMPGADGIETLKKLKKNKATKSIPVFMLTAKGMLGEVNQLFTAGADDYISKPFNPDTIIDTIKSKLEQYTARKG